MSDKVSEQVASKIVSSKAISTAGTSKDVSLTLHSKGRPTRIVVNPSESSPTIITHEKLSDLQSGLGNLSNTKMVKGGQF